MQNQIATMTKNIKKNQHIVIGWTSIDKAQELANQINQQGEIEVIVKKIDEHYVALFKKECTNIDECVESIKKTSNLLLLYYLNKNNQNIGPHAFELISAMAFADKLIEKGLLLIL